MVWPTGAHLVFAITLLPLLALAAVGERSRAAFHALTVYLYSLSSARGGIQGAASEVPKFAILRIIFGLLLLNRFYYIWLLSYPADAANPWFQFVLYADMVAALLLVAGLASQWALVFLAVFQWSGGEAILETSTLGNDIAAILSLLLFLTMAGSRFSADAWLVRRFPGLRRAMLYFDVGDKDIVAAKFLALFAYWLVCTYSLTMHLGEAAWMQGFAGPQLLANNFMSRFHDLFVAGFESSAAFVLLAKIGLWIMLPWYIGILPFVLLGGWPRRFIIYWGILFFILSNGFLMLGWLAEFEWLLWAGIFLFTTRKVDVAYDDRCNLCDRTIQVLKAVDFTGNIRLRPVSQNGAWLASRGIDEQTALHDLQGWDETRQRIYSGYDLYTTLSRTVPVMLPLWPVLALGKITTIGPRIYRFVADRRIRYFGACQLPSPKADWTAKTADTGAGQGTRITGLIGAHVLLLGGFFAIALPAPYLNWSGLKNVFAEAAKVYGIAHINVFNKTDLRMSENWFTISGPDGREIPVFTRNGTRGWYHKSDRIYFGGTVRFRRWAIGRQGCHYSGDRWKRLVGNLVALHASRTGQKGPYTYRQYFRPLADAARINRLEYRHPPARVVCTVRIDGTERLANSRKSGARK